MKLEVKNLVGEHCVTQEDGQRIYDEIFPKLAAGQPVQINFAGVTIFASPFFNFAIGQLLKDLKPEALNKLLEVEGLSSDGALVWQRVVKNAKEYYKNPKARMVVDEILKQQAEEE